MKNRVGKYYKTEQGKFPYKKWYDSLSDTRAKHKIDIRIDRAEDGNFGDYKNLKGGVLEMRIDYGSGYRVYYGIDKNEIILLLIGGTKGSQQKDITTAKGYWKEFKSRNR